MKLRRPCQHGRYDKHLAPSAFSGYESCPGGVFLPDDTLMFALNETGDQIAVIAWPEWANRRLTLELDGMSVRIREKPSIVVRNNRFDVEST